MGEGGIRRDGLGFLLNGDGIVAIDLDQSVSCHGVETTEVEEAELVLN
jgi:hypothetical protein